MQTCSHCQTQIQVWTTGELCRYCGLPNDLEVVPAIIEIIPTDEIEEMIIEEEEEIKEVKIVKQRKPRKILMKVEEEAKQRHKAVKRRMKRYL